MFSLREHLVTDFVDHSCISLSDFRFDFGVATHISFCICLVAKSRTSLSPNRGSVGGRDMRRAELICVMIN